MRFISFAFFFVVATTTFAFDPRTHVWVAQEVLNDVIPDGKLTIDGKEYPVPSNIVDALRLHPDFYRMGNIGPDAHPDMIVGQSFIHPGTRGGWQTDDWAKWLQDQSRLDGSREAIAYSVGLWGHVSGDIIMHSYVNTYAGDYFLLFDEQEVELRHFALEHYIGDRTPQLKDHLGAAVGPYDKCLQTPSSFLASTLILNDTVANEYLRAPQLSLHLLALYRLHKSVHDIRVGIERLADPVDDQLTKLDSIREAADEALKKALEKLEVLIPTLAPLEKQVGALKAIIDEQRAINEPLEAAATQGEKAVLRALDALRNLEERISSLLKRLEQQIPREISAIERSVKEFEENIREWTDEASRQAGKIGDLNRFKDDLDREVSNLADELDGLLRHLPGYKKVKGRLNSARSKLESAKKELANAEENLRTSTDNVTHFVKKKEEQARQLASLVAEKTKVVPERTSEPLPSLGSPV